MQGFISYTHRDSEYLTRFATHLRAIERITPFKFWYDKRRLQAGDAFDEVIRTAILDSEIFLLLVSPDFFDSDYVFNKELPAIAEKRRF